jgi:hypothetical protein
MYYPWWLSLAAAYVKGLPLAVVIGSRLCKFVTTGGFQQ